jgi:hypothetical protein
MRVVTNSVLFCRLYFAATSGVCLIRSGAADFPKKLHSQKEKKSTTARRNLLEICCDCSNIQR